MGLMLLLKFALVCIDYLAWPVIALGYPLFASIRAVETDSKCHLKKLTIYWTLFSLISLFEFTFLKVIVWIPFWDSIRLLAIIWLVVPRFQGACRAYQILVRPVLSVDLRAVIDRLYKPKEDKHVMGATFLDVAEQYIKENGSEALERLIATKVTSCITQPKTVLVEQEGNKSEKNILVLKPEKKTDEVAILNQVQYAEIIPPDTSDRPPETLVPKKGSGQEWTCGLCKVATNSETVLNAHLQGSEHMSNCQAIKETKFPSSSSSSNQTQAKPKQGGGGGANQIFNFYCNVCSVNLLSDIDLASHLKGKLHMSNITNQTQAKPKQGGGGGAILYCNVCSVNLPMSNLASHLNGKRHMSNITKTPSIN